MMSYVCDAAVHKDSKGKLNVAVAAKYKIEVFEFDENNMIGDKADDVKDLCASCYNMLTIGTQKVAAPKAPKKQAVKA